MAKFASLDSCWAKVERANENIQNLDRELVKFIDSEPYEFVLDGHVKTRYKKFAKWRVVSVKDVPLRFSVLTGEIIHHLRSSLDLLVFQLIRESTGADPQKLTDIEFPVLTEDPSLKGIKEYEAKLGRKIKGVSATAEARIKTLQPYHCSNLLDSPLYVIHKLNVIDKHRLLLAIVSRLEIVEQRSERPEVVLALSGVYYAVQAGAVLYGYCPFDGNEADVHTDFTATVAFSETGLIQGKPIAPTLNDYSAFISDTLNSFSGEF